MIYLKFVRHFIPAILLLLVPMLSQAQEANVDNGKKLFKAKCASCHANNMKSDLTGPALGGVEERWAEYPREDLYSWIRNSQALIGAGHPRAKELWSQWKPVIMNNFLELSDQDMEDLLAYVKYQYEKKPEAETVAAVDGAAPADGGGMNTTYLIVLLSVLFILSLVLARIVNNLNRLARIKEGQEPGPQKSIVEILTSRPIVMIATFILVILGGYTVVNNAIGLGRQQGYAPDQPIKFSHALHAGTHKIDCQYCHDGARRSKHSVIPASNTCINCHKVVKKGPQYGTAEIVKIYAASGFDPINDVYFDEAVPKEQRMKIYEEFIRSSDEDKKLKEEDIQMQLVGIEKSVKFGEPIEWIRIHNLPDHVYFNHQQHVVAGGVECQTCHGPMEEMEVVQQYAPLSMGWCINCHRETEVQFTDNPYYDSYEKYHEELSTGERAKVTVEDIGGLECQKCHY